MLMSISQAQKDSNKKAMDRQLLMLDRLSMNMEEFIYEYFYIIRNSIDLNAEKSLLAISDENKINEIKSNQLKLIDDLKEIETKCSNKFKKCYLDRQSTGNEKLDEFKKALKEIELKENDKSYATNQIKKKLEREIESEYLKYKCLALAGYNVTNFDELSEKDVESIQKLNVTCSYDYKLASGDDKELTEEQAFLIYYFEVF
jgi:hypothetical protein